MIEFLKKKYNIIKRIGKGGMAEIYLATTKDTEEKIAIKILHPSQKNSVINQKRFKSEIELTKKINSEHVVKILDSHWDDEVQYIAMEYIEGEILKNYINSRTKLNVEEAVDFAKQIALGLQAIHLSGIVHRDIKASNIMIESYNNVRIIDFGIAINEDSERLTRTDSIIGSAHYLAPELVEQKPASVQTDVYALGILFFEMLTGDVPFREKDILQTAFKHQNSVVPQVNKIFETIPQSVANVVAKATVKDASKRYKTMTDFYNDLDSVFDQERLLEKPYSFSDKPKFNFKDFINSRKFLYFNIGFFFIILLIVIIILGVKIF